MLNRVEDVLKKFGDRCDYMEVRVEDRDRWVLQWRRL